MAPRSLSSHLPVLPIQHIRRLARQNKRPFSWPHIYKHSGKLLPCAMHEHRPYTPVTYITFVFHFSRLPSRTLPASPKQNFVPLTKDNFMSIFSYPLKKILLLLDGQALKNIMTAFRSTPLHDIIDRELQVHYSLLSPWNVKCLPLTVEEEPSQLGPFLFPSYVNWAPLPNLPLPPNQLDPFWPDFTLVDHPTQKLSGTTDDVKTVSRGTYPRIGQ